MSNVAQIVKDIKAGNIKPIYFLMGDEPYYIDSLSDYIENNILTEDERGFNQMTLYGRDVDVEEIISNAKRYPMMAERQVIIVKEAQDLSRTIHKLTDYVENLQPTTVLVICYKYKKLDGRLKLGKLIKQHGVLFESKKLYDNQIADWIRRVLASSKYEIEPKASHMLVEFLGTDLSKIKNELDKLKIVLPNGGLITAQTIEDNIGISKDFNVFELRKAIGAKQIVKVNSIINYFSHNIRLYPPIVTISLVNSYFTQLLQYHGLKDKSKGNVAKTLGVSTYFVDDYISASRNYPMRKVSQIIGLLREFDMKAKGVGATNMSQKDLLKELMFKIIH